MLNSYRITTSSCSSQGHCLVISKRVTPRFSDLSSDEISDLWITAKTVGVSLEKHFDAQALNYAIQDGPVAGQSVPHVHVHIIPRKPNDFERNDQIYDELEKADMNRSALKVDAPDDRKPRTKDEMAAEAAILRQLFSTSLPIPTDDTDGVS